MKHHPSSWTTRKLMAVLRKELEDSQFNFNEQILNFLIGYPRVPKVSLLAEIYLTLRPPNYLDNLDPYKEEFKTWASDILEDSYNYLDNLMVKYQKDELLGILSSKERIILEKHWSGVSYAEIGGLLGVTRERIRQIGKCSGEKIFRRAVIRNKYPELEKASKKYNKHFLDKILDSCSEHSEYISNRLNSYFSNYKYYRKNPVSIKTHQETQERHIEDKLEEEKLETFRHNLNKIADEDLEWFIGFWEGDGSFSPTSLSLSQKDPRVLNFTKELLGLPDWALKNYGKIYELYLPTRYSRILRSLIQHKLVSKSRQIQFSLVDPQHSNIGNRIPSLPWIVGFWDAEGCFYYQGKKITTNVTQKDKEVLLSIQKVIGGNIYEKHFPCLHLNGSETEKFMPIYLKYSHNYQKKERLIKFKESLDLWKARQSQKNKAIKQDTTEVAVPTEDNYEKYLENQKKYWVSEKGRKVRMPEIEDSYSKFERTQERYWNSEAGKAAKTRYNLSEAGKATRKKYLESENGKKALLRYYLSEKAETTRQKRQALLKLFRQLDNYLRAHSDKTMEDYFNQLTQKKEEL